MERIREILRNMKDIPKGICISPTDDVKKDYITTPSIFFNAPAIPIRKSLITDSYLSELGLDKQTYSERELNENLQLSNVQSGVYLVTVQDGSRKEVKKIVVE